MVGLKNTAGAFFTFMDIAVKCGAKYMVHLCTHALATIIEMQAKAYVRDKGITVVRKETKECP